MLPDTPQNPLYERYASQQIGRVYSAKNRYGTWRDLWVTLAECERELGLPITEEQIKTLRQALEGEIDFDRVAELERRTRHDVVAHLRHFAEQADQIQPQSGAGGILHLGATSAFVLDNTEVILMRQALRLIAARLAATIRALTDFARRHRALPCLAYTHFQPAQLTTVGKRACLWLQDFLMDLAEVQHRLSTLRCRGVKGTTGTQASFLTLFHGDHAKVRELDKLLTDRIGFKESFPVTGQTYPRKQDSQVLANLAGIAESCHKYGTDLRLLQGVGELSEPFDAEQVGSSAMAYKRNPVRSERMCGLARRLITDSLNGPLNAATQWLERSLDDSANRRLVIADSFLGADAVLGLAAHISAGLVVREAVIASRVARELPFMATETLLMESVLRGGDRQQLHERLRGYSLRAQDTLESGGDNSLVDLIVSDPEFRLTRQEVDPWLDPVAFTGRSAEQVDEFLDEVVAPALEGAAAAEVSAPRV